MLLKIRVRNVASMRLNVEEAEIDLFEQRSGSLAEALAAYLMDGDSPLESEVVQQSLLARFDADVFLSHGTGDRKQALQLAVLLEQVGVKVFVDSCLWRHMYTLQQQMDERFSMRGNAPGTHHFQYYKVTRTTASSCMVLATTLQRMIDRCELFLHLEGEPMRIGACVEDSRHTGSPWVFAELAFARHMARRARPRPSLSTVSRLPPVHEAMLAGPDAAHLMEWSALLRAIADTAHLPPPARHGGPPLFLDHLYGKLPLSAQERLLLGWV